MAEVNLLDKYPKSQRPIEERGKRKLARAGWLDERPGQPDSTEILIEQRLLQLARQFGREYFDADRLYGYGGYYYHPRFWSDVVLRFRDYYCLPDAARVLDVGCAKGHLLYDFVRLMPRVRVAGIDISEYACSKALPEVKPFIHVGNARTLPFPDRSFDLVLSINTIDHLPIDECARAVREIQRVTSKDAFICVNAWRTEEERERLLKWNVTALTVMHVTDWERFFNDNGYTGDYYWFIAE